MTDSSEVISAFLDDEMFEPEALAQALAEPVGRQLLIDLIVLRDLVRADAPPPCETASRRSRLAGPLKVALAAASLILAVAAGYAVGERRTTAETQDRPVATRVVQPTTSWQVVPGPSMVTQ